MKKILKKTKNELFHTIEDKKIIGTHSKLINHNLLLYGDCSRLSGDLNELPKKDRKTIIDLSDLITDD